MYVGLSINLKALSAFLLAVCITGPLCKAQRASEVIEQEVSIVQSAPKNLKRKVAIGRFSNETQYGKGLFYDKQNDPMGKQVLDVLSAKLAASDKFLLLERGDLETLLAECKNNGNDFTGIGADYMIIGSITEYGRKTVGKSNGLSSQKSQVVEASVAIRLVDLSTGLIIYSDEGKGEATLTTKSSLFKSQSAEYDATLSDKAISAAISQLVENIINKCTDKPWRTYFLSYDENGVLIAGGKSQGLNIGDEFVIKTKGKKVRNPQTGVMIELPGKEIGKVKIDLTGGDTPETEYSFVSISTNSEIDPLNINEYYIEEIK
ncbi:MAG: CsgG/HfaB family protein [Lachnoclostridium sp.]|nr:CsgG/HfaB family protein [Lachnoclostridium sp.]